MSIDTQLEKMLRKVEKPARYTGGEVNSVKKDPEHVHGHADFIQYIEQE